MIRHARMRGHRTLFLPGLDHASIAAQFVLDRIIAEEGREPPVARARALPRADARVRRDDARGDARPAAPCRRIGRLGSAALHDGRRLRAAPSGSPSSGCTGRPGLPHRGADQLVPGLPDQRQRPRGRLDAGDRHVCGRSATTSSTRRPAGPTRTRRSPSRRPAPRRSWATPASPSIPTTSAMPALVGRRVRIPFVERDVPIVADDVVDRAFGTGRGEDHAGPRSRRLRDRSAPRPAGASRSSTTTPPSPSTATAYDGLDRYAARAAIVADLDARGDLAATHPHEMVLGRCQRSNDVIEPRLKTQWFIRTRPLARAGARRRRAAAGRASSPSGSRRPGSTG